MRAHQRQRHLEESLMILKREYARTFIALASAEVSIKRCLYTERSVLARRFFAQVVKDITKRSEKYEKKSNGITAIYYYISFGRGNAEH